MQTIRVYEHDRLSVGDQLKEQYFDELVRYNDKTGQKYFSVGYKKIIFKNYVGLIQVGKLAIEILPKIEKQATREKYGRWQTALLEMLHFARLIRMESVSNASQSGQKSNLLEIIVQQFLNEVQKLCNDGLLRQYRFSMQNRFVLKGRLVFDKHIAKNMVHSERFYTEAQVYDIDNKLNQVLLQALLVLKDLYHGSRLTYQINNLISCFDGVTNRNAQADLNENVHFTRRTRKYKTALIYARLILNNFSPDLRSGQYNVIALLFDMNMLFEKVATRLFQKAESNFNHIELRIKSQSVRKFWQRKTIRPDIVGEYDEHSTSQKVIFIVDTKWKLPEQENPSDNDLKQIFVYNIQFHSKYGLLLYPGSGPEEGNSLGVYSRSDCLKPEFQNHFCSVEYIDFLDDNGRINRSAAVPILERIVSMAS